MKNLLPWLASLFKVEVVWIDKGHGQWVKRRRYHPVTKAVMVACVLALCVLGGRFLYGELQTPDDPEVFGELGEPGEVSQRLDAQINQFRMTDFPDSMSEDVYPGPIPDDLNIIGDELWVRIDKSGYKLYLYRGLDVEKTYDIAVGRNPGDKERAGDNKTPNGTFTVQSIEDSRSWTHDFRDGNGKIRGAYGPWFIRLRTRWKGIGIHGTHDPDSLGSMVSEGCIRMHNSELEELKQFASANMKVVIEE